MSLLLTQDIELSESDFRKISRLVYEHCGINLHEGKKELVRARLAKRLREGSYRSFKQYMTHVLNDPSGREFSILVDSLSTNLTSFFRESQHFDFLTQRHLPALLDRKRKKSDFRLRAWSAGCSSGEEPYSIAITLLEATKGQGRWDTRILATDISTTVLETARMGIYDAERVEPVPTILRQKYLMPQRTSHRKIYEVGSQIRNAVIFRYLNLMQEWPIKGPLDIIFCRNVMIYFDKTTQSRLVNRYWDILNSGGVLFTGHSESLTGIDHKFDYIQPTIYTKP